MAENILETRILLRYDTYNNWMNSDVILKQGEMAIAAINRRSLGNTDTLPENTPPAIGLKVGDGTHYFDELPWVQAVSADVYNWAKSSSKPTYTANEIQGLQAFVEQYGGGGSAAISGSSYRIIYDNSTNKYVLQYFDEEQDDWISTTSSIDLSAILKRLNDLEKFANGEQGNLGNIEYPLMSFIYEGVTTYLNRLDVADTEVANQFVTSVSEENGKISVTRRGISASDITSGTLSTSQGGTGLTKVEPDEVLVGDNNGNITTKLVSNNLTNANSGDLPTAGAVVNYVNNATAGLTGAMHYIGEASVTITHNSHIDPQIQNYNFSNAQPGDVVLANNAQEFVWTGSAWRLLGDEGSYAVKGSIVNSDISEDAGISISKIDNLQESLSDKVDKQEGKNLSSNDYTDEDKNKLADIESNAQENVIEHVFLNSNEIIPTAVGGVAKSVNLQLVTVTQEQIDKLNKIENGAQANVIEHILLNGNEVLPATVEQQPNSVNLLISEFDANSQNKLASIDTGAQVNTIEKIIFDGVEITPNENKVVSITSDPHTEHINRIEQIFINGIEWVPNAQKQVKITIDQAALNLNVLEGAVVPNDQGGTTEVSQVNKKLELEKIAVSGDVKDLKQTADTYITLDCGSSTEVI